MLQVIQSFFDCFFHVKIFFLSENTTSKLQPLDAGIINSFKVFYRKQLLRHALARIKPGIMEAWRKIKEEMIANCFSKCAFNEATLDLFIDGGADSEFVGLQNYILEISPESTVDSYQNQDQDAVISVNTEMKKEMRGKNNLLRD